MANMNKDKFRKLRRETIVQAEPATEAAPAAEEAPAPKKRGRPKGSTNKKA